MKLCVIPARAGSKRIKNKNLRIFRGKPLIAHAVDIARGSAIFDQVIVSTDSPEIMQIAEASGADVPFSRPPELADDHATSVAVIRHAIETMSDQGGDIDLVGCIYPTSVFLKKEHLIEGMSKLRDPDIDCVFSAAGFSAPLERAFRRHATSGLEMANPQAFNTRSQDLPRWYHDVGQFYLAKRQHWFEDTLFNDRADFVEFPEWAVQDIDTEADWELMQIKMAVLEGLSEEE